MFKTNIRGCDVKTNPNLMLGVLWCDNCRKYKGDSERQRAGHTAAQGSVADSQYDVGKPEETLKDLDCSSIMIPKETETVGSSSSTNIPESLGNICCDPYNRHAKLVTKYLRTITELDAKSNPELKEGLWWCDNCRKSIGNEGLSSSSFKISKKCENAPTRSLGEEKEKTLDEFCNPYKVHSKPIHKGLRKINEDDKKKHATLTVGLFWCDTCRKANPADCFNLENTETESSETTTDFGLASFFAEITQGLVADSEPNSQEIGTNVGSQTSGSSGSQSLSPVVQREAARRTLTTIGLSPLATSALKTKGSRVLAAKRKVEEATEVVRKKVCRALGIAVDELIAVEGRKAMDYDLLMNEIKQKLPSASKLQKYQLLSLVPLSMSVNDAAIFFYVSRTLVSSVRKLKEEKGILPILDFTRTSTVLESTKQLVVQYYCREDNCKILPGSRDCVSIGRGVCEQKRLLLCNLTELYQSFKHEYDGLKVGLSMFSSLRPKWCMFAGSAGTHEQCICQTHQNYKLIMHAINIKTHYRDLIKLCVCDTKDQSCLLKVCDAYPTQDKVIETLRKYVELPDLPESECFDSEDECDYFEGNIKFRQWKLQDKKTDMVVQVCSRSDLLELASKQMADLIPHDFISFNQRNYLRKLKEKLPRNKAVVGMDFSMNYNCLIQGAVQSYHWSPKQATVHITLIYFKNESNELKHVSLILISDDLNHDVPLVRKFMERTVAYIKENLPHVTEIEYSTDGCASQYKSKGYFLVLCRHEEDFGLKASHTYYATSPGKSQNDADGGTVKRKARRASLQRPLSDQIINATDLFLFCEKELKEKFLFQFVSKSEVDPYRQIHEECMEALETVPGTRSFHFVQPQPGNALACWRISDDKNERPTLLHNLFKVAKPTEPPVINGIYVVARIAKQRFVAVVTDVYKEEAEADVSLLMPKLPAKEFSCPSETKTATVPLPHILCGVTLREENNNVYLTDADLEKLYKLRILRKQL